MMKAYVHEMRSGGVSITQVNPKLIETMTGTGYGWEDAQIELEITKYTNPPAPEVGKPEAQVRPYIQALAHGGVTEGRAYSLINDHGHVAECLSCHLVDISELPEDRTNRNSWHWDRKTGRITLP